MSIFGVRTIVNCGVSTYEEGEQRLKERGTSNHSTVEIDNQDSSEVWSSFRVAKRAFPIDLKINNNNNNKSIQIECSHNGYKRLKGSPIHKRNWLIDKDKFTIQDEIMGGYNSAIANYIFHPHVKIYKINSKQFSIDLNNNQIISINLIIGNALIIDKNYSEGFGKNSNTSCLAIELINSKSKIEIDWS